MPQSEVSMKKFYSERKTEAPNLKQGKETQSRRFYLTTAIPYANAKPHIGFGQEIVQADTIARFKKLAGYNVHFLTGTDEHGSKNFQTAKEKGVDTQKFVQENTKEFAKLKEILNLSNNDFIKTSDKKRHWPAVEKFWQLCAKKDDIYKKKYTSLYCIGCEEFKTEKDLKNGVCPEHPNQNLEKISEENYFFKLSKYQKEIQNTIEKGKFKITPKSRENEVLSFVKGGLEDFSISRLREKLPWGIPVPGDPDQTVYVWFDALINYISALGFGSDEKNFKKYWPADLHVIGKGVLRFHAIYWPAMLSSAGLVWPKEILVHGYVSIEGQKISKSQGNVIEPKELTKKYGIDPIRYYLLREIPAFEDGNFSEERFREIYNGELANSLGNLVSRVAKLCQNSNITVNRAKKEKFDHIVKDFLENYEFHLALKRIFEIISEANKYIDSQKPWKLKGEKQKEILDKIIEDVRRIAFCLKPFLPQTSEDIEKIFAGPKIGAVKPLFPKIEN